MRLPGVVLNKAASSDDAAKVQPYLEGLEVMATLPYDAAVAASEAVPDAGQYVAAVDALRDRLGSHLY